MANSFRKALKHLKSTQINEQPTNSMSKVYAINPPGYDNRAPDRETTFVPDVDGNWPAGIPGTPGEVNYTRPEGVWQGGSNWDRFSNADLSQDSIGENGTSLFMSSVLYCIVKPGAVPVFRFIDHAHEGYGPKETEELHFD